MVAKSIATGTRDHSVRRIEAALECCVNTLLKQGYKVGDMDSTKPSVLRIQSEISKENKIE